MKEKKYMQDKDFARVPEHKDNPDYRMIIMYTFYQHFLFHKIQNEISIKMDEMVYAFQARQPFNLEYDSKCYFEMYPEKMHGQTGYILVDKTDASPALIIYPFPTSSYNKKPNKPRMLALIMAIKDIAKTKKQILEAFSTTEKWIDLENKLKTIFHYKNLSDDEKQVI